MAAIDEALERDDARDRLLSAAEAACAAWLVICHEVYLTSGPSLWIGILAHGLGDTAAVALTCF